MKLGSFLVLLVGAAACSGSDQSLGETRRAPGPIIEPMTAGSGGGATAGASATAGSSAIAGSGGSAGSAPMPTVPTCEDSAKHSRLGSCVAAGSCLTTVIESAGYECPNDLVCCDEQGPGCPPPPAPCGNSSGGTTGAAGETSAGAGGA